jgi:hypothetical protein
MANSDHAVHGNGFWRPRLVFRPSNSQSVKDETLASSFHLSLDPPARYLGVGVSDSDPAFAAVIGLTPSSLVSRV